MPPSGSRICVIRQSWRPGDTREVEAAKIDRQEGIEYDSYRRVYLADGHEWAIAGQIARDDGVSQAPAGFCRRTTFPRFDD